MSGTLLQPGHEDPGPEGDALGRSPHAPVSSHCCAQAFVEGAIAIPEKEIYTNFRNFAGLTGILEIRLIINALWTRLKK